MTIIFALETSCDETAAAVLRDGRELLANVVASQTDLHARYGGVFPEMASRQHVLTVVPVVRETLAQAKVGWADVDAIAAVHGPGLAGSLLVGLNVAKALALATGKPLVGVNHLEAHVYANWLPVPQEPPERSFVAPPFPLVCLIVSGGHTDLLLMRDHHDYVRLGRTVDDAAGEAFDKVARLLGLGYPGGPAIERAAQGANPNAFALPRGLPPGGLDFSFSGIKTAVLRLVQEMQHGKEALADLRGQKMVAASLGGPSSAASSSPAESSSTQPTPAESERSVASQDGAVASASIPRATQPVPVNDLAASFQLAVVDALVQRTAEAAQRYGAVQVLLAGGVAANQLLRSQMRERVKVRVRWPPIRFCTDNAAMVAAAGYYRYLSGLRSGLDLDVLPSLSLT